MQISKGGSTITANNHLRLAGRSGHRLENDAGEGSSDLRGQVRHAHALSRERRLVRYARYGWGPAYPCRRLATKDIAVVPSGWTVGNRKLTAPAAAFASGLVAEQHRSEACRNRGRFGWFYSTGAIRGGSSQMRKLTAVSIAASFVALILVLAQAGQAAKNPPPVPSAADIYGDMAVPYLPVHTLDPIF